MTKAPIVTAEEVRALRKTIATLEEDQNRLRVCLQELEAFVQNHKHKTFTGKPYRLQEEVRSW